MVKEGYNPAGLSFLPIGLGAFIGAIFLLSLAIWHPSHIDFLPLFPSLVLIGGGLVIRALKPRYQHLEECRQAAASRNNAIVSLAAEQPVPDEGTLVLPLTIRLAPKWATIFIWIAILWAVSAGAFFLFLADPDGSNPLLIVVAATSISAFFAGLFAWIGYHYERLEVSQEGLTVQHQGSFETISAIKWHDARLFAISPSNLLGKRAYLPSNYELSGPNAVVCWVWVRRKMPFTFAKLCKPALR